MTVELPGETDPGVLAPRWTRWPHHDALRTLFTPAPAGGTSTTRRPGRLRAGSANCAVSPAGRTGSGDRGGDRRGPDRVPPGYPAAVRPVCSTAAGAAAGLLLTAHHLVVDGVSWRVLLEDLERPAGRPPGRRPPGSRDHLGPGVGPPTARAHRQGRIRGPARDWEAVARHCAARCRSTATAATPPAEAVTVPSARSAPATCCARSPASTAPGSTTCCSPPSAGCSPTGRDAAPSPSAWRGTAGRTSCSRTRPVPHGRLVHLPVPGRTARPARELGQCAEVREGAAPSGAPAGLGYGALRHLAGTSGSPTRRPRRQLQLPGPVRLVRRRRGPVRAVPGGLDGADAPAAGRAPAGRGCPDRGRPAGGQLALQRRTAPRGDRHRPRRGHAAGAGGHHRALRPTGAGGRTPSDFPLARLDQAATDRLAGDGPGIDDIYPLTPMQAGMTFHSLVASGPATLSDPGCAVLVGGH